MKRITSIAILWAIALFPGCLIPQTPEAPDNTSEAPSAGVSVSGFQVFDSVGNEILANEPVSRVSNLFFLKATFSAQNYQTDSAFALDSVQVYAYGADGAPYVELPAVALRKGALDISIRAQTGLNRLQIIAAETLSNTSDTAETFLNYLPGQNTLRFLLSWQDNGAPLDLDLVVYGDNGKDSVSSAKPYPVWTNTNQYPFHYRDGQGGFDASEEIKLVNPNETAYSVGIRGASFGTAGASVFDSLTVTMEDPYGVTFKQASLLQGLTSRDTNFVFGVSNLADTVSQVTYDTTRMFSVTSFAGRNESLGTSFGAYAPVLSLGSAYALGIVDYTDLSDNSKLTPTQARLRIMAGETTVKDSVYAIAKNTFFARLDTLQPNAINKIQLIVTDSAAYPDSSEFYLAYFPNAPFLEIKALWNDLDADLDLKAVTAAGATIVGPESDPPYLLTTGNQYIYHAGDNFLTYLTEEVITVVNPQETAYYAQLHNFQDYGENQIVVDSLKSRLVAAGGTVAAGKDTTLLAIPSGQSLTFTLSQPNYVWP